jgi:tRNA threonylcarbamoyladenosine biosynthesis protein TsaE
MQSEHFDCQNETEMLALGATLAARLSPGKLIFLQGELGAGKTTLVQGVLRGLGYEQSVKSPTFTLVESYELRDFTAHHFDLYRITHYDELETLGFRDYVSRENVCLIEWPEKASGYLPTPDILVTITYQNTQRHIQIESNEKN